MVLAVGNGVLALPSAIFWMSAISMQLVEFFTWNRIKIGGDTRTLSQLALALIILQPGLYIYAHFNGPPTVKAALYAVYAFFVVAAVSKTYLKPGHPFSMIPAENGHLAWKWMPRGSDFWPIAIYLGLIAFVIAYNREYLKLAFYAAVVGVIYYFYAASETWGSLWCWVVNALALYLLYQIFWKDICLLPIAKK